MEILTSNCVDTGDLPARTIGSPVRALRQPLRIHHIPVPVSLVQPCKRQRCACHRMCDQMRASIRSIPGSTRMWRTQSPPWASSALCKNARNSLQDPLGQSFTCIPSIERHDTRAATDLEKHKYIAIRLWPLQIEFIANIRNGIIIQTPSQKCTSDVRRLHNP